MTEEIDIEPEKVEFYHSEAEKNIEEKQNILNQKNEKRKEIFVKRSQQQNNKAFGYHFDANHEAALEAHLIQIIGKLGQLPTNYVPPEVVGEAMSLIIEIKGFLNKWDIHESYSEKCSNYVNNFKSVDLFVIRQLYQDFVQWAKVLGFRDPVVSSEKWEKRFLGF